MIKILLILLISLQYTFANPNYGNFSPVQKNGESYMAVTSWNSAEGIKLLAQSSYKQDFYSLASHFQPQENPLYCGIASSVIILNALRQGSDLIPNSSNKTTKPTEFGGGFVDFKTYTQDELLGKQTNAVKEKSIIDLVKKDPKLKKYDPGLTLAQLSGILKKYNLDVKIFYAQKNNDKAIVKFKKILKDTLNNKNAYIIANFHGKTVGTLPGGHISPIVAYNQKANKIMILDVASHKQPWFWVDIDIFYQAMQKKDGSLPRGFLIIKEKIQ